MCALAVELINRGNRVTFFHMADVEKSVSRRGIDFRPLGLTGHPPGCLAETLREMGQLRGAAALRFTLGAALRTTEMFCQDGPAAIKSAQVEVLLVDQTEPAGRSVAEYLGLPYITICNALMMNREPGIPPPFTNWSYRPGFFSAIRNAAGYAASDILLRPVASRLADYRRRWKLPALKGLESTFSKVAQISQQPASFDFPRKNLPACFLHAGPLRQPDRKTSFPWHLLDGRPLVYASLGTLQNKNWQLFQVFAEACRTLDVQLVISHGRGLSPDQASSLDALVVDYAPQQELLAKASLTITHCGLNTVLDSLSYGVPILGIPVTFEQPAIAERIRWTGAGKAIPFAKATSGTVRSAVREILEGQHFRVSARKVADDIARSGGCNAAANHIESLLRARQPLA